MDNAEKALWKYVINKGYVIETKSYYGNTYDFERTEVIRNNMDKINWDKTNHIRQDTEYEFTGTFADDISVQYLYGKLSYMNRVYEFHLKMANQSIIELVKEVLNNEQM